jgi:acetyl esterase/lipase
VVIHGGSWSSGDSKQLPELNSYLAKAGYNVAAINYRKAPQYQNPLPVIDVKNALTYLRAHADALNIDTNNFVLLGRSAGAQIALLAAYTLKDSGIKGVIDFYGPADMVWGYSKPASKLVMDSRGVMERYLGGTYQEAQKNYFASSPIEFVNKTSPPTLIIHGENDVLVAYEHSRRLNEKLGQVGVKHYWLKLPWATHGFDYNLHGPGGQLSTYAVRRFLDDVVGQTVHN